MVLNFPSVSRSVSAKENAKIRNEKTASEMANREERQIFEDFLIFKFLILFYY